MGDYNSTMGCGGSEEPVADESDDKEGDFNVSVGIRVIKEDGESKLFLLGFDVGPQKKASNVKRMVNHILKANAESLGQEKDIETLIPTWTPAWDSFKMDRKLKKSLKHSKNSAGEDYNALEAALPKDDEPGKEIWLIGGDAEVFDPDFWNAHLDFTADEFQKVECSDFSDDSC